ncbi:MAG: VWA domain-containing protein [Acidobacteria bacterium]|nr:VWA domain-containing protein [Acidobacteriota bacterium]
MLRSFDLRSVLSQLIFATLLLFVPTTFVHSQNQQSRSEQKPAQTAPPDSSQDPDSVVRISTQLVQIDAVVTDRNGAHVENLTEDDFVLTVDGKKQSLSHFKLIKLVSPKKPADGGKNLKAAPATPVGMPEKALAPEDVRRTIAFVVDDLGLSFQSMTYTREAIRKFVREQMEEGDLVGIIRTGRGLGMLQQFTGDKRILNTAIDRLTWNPFSRDMVPRFPERDANNPLPEPQRQAVEEADARTADFRETVFSVGTLGSLNFVIRGLRELPGRKMVILLSDGFKLFGKDRNNSLVLENLRRLTDLANRSSVVVYSIDPKGLQTLMPDATGTGVPRPGDYTLVAQQNFDSQEGLTFLARETGGQAFLNNNDINLGIRKSLEDASSYYLLGFDPEDEKFDRKYHSIKLKLTRSGLTVRTRAGFLGVADKERRREFPVVAVDSPEARNRDIVGALYSPFGARDLGIQMTSFFFNSEKQGSFIRSLYQIDMSKLDFKDDPQRNGVKTVKLELAAFTFNEAGSIIDQHGRAFTLEIAPQQYESAMTKGLFYSDDFIIKKPGAYQLRCIIRDPSTGKLGSSSQFINVPDLSRKRLALSGVVLTIPADFKPMPEQMKSEVNLSPSARRFPRNGFFDYGAAIYNVTTDPKTGKSNLVSQVEIYSEGKPVYQGPTRPIEDKDTSSQSTRSNCAGRMMLANLPPGDYVFRLIVTDALAKSKYAKVDQWTDFGVR